MGGREMKSSTGSLLRSGLSRVQMNVVSKVWRNMEYDLGFPLVHLIAKSGLWSRERHNPAIV